ncbi:MAG: hypothetical protein V4521_01585 [Pseudomonadota bacterium]
MPMLPEEVIKSIEEGQRLRGWIANGYSQVEYLLGDIVTQAFLLESYADIAERLPHKVEKRINLVRSILEIDGPFSEFMDDIEAVIVAFEIHHDLRNLLAHGFCSAYHTPVGDFGLEFRKWHRVNQEDKQLIKTFRLVDLEYHRAQLADVSQRMLELSFRIHDKLGLLGP